jgi:hypothetical protein
MTAYLVFRAAKLVLLLALAAVLLPLASGRPPSRRLRAALTVLVALAAAAFVNFGLFHAATRQPVHHWDAFHYFMGAKYLPELGYTRLYEATWVAGRELGAFDGIERIRDLPTYLARDTRAIDAAAVRARFSDARWRSFKADLLFFGPRIPDWRRLLLDHGFNDPPPRALLLHGLLREVPAMTATLALITSVDYLLIAGALLAARAAFGPVAGAVAAAFFLLSFFARFDFIGGSILRWDWIAALVAGAAALACGAGMRAGWLLAYATVARVFPALFLVPLVVTWVHKRRAGTRDPALDRCLLTVGGGVLAAVLVTAALGETAALSEFVAKIRLHGATAFTNHVGLGTWLVFQRAPWMLYEGAWAVDPAVLAAARPAAWVVPAVSALYLLAATPLILRARPVQSMMYAVPLVYCAVSPAGYYYSFTILLVLLAWHDANPDRLRLLGIGLLILVNAVGYALEIGSADHLPLFHAMSTLLGAYFLAWLALEYLRARAAGASFLDRRASGG